MPRPHYLLLLALALLPSAWLAWTWRDMPHLGHHHDDGTYLVSSLSLARGTGYRILSLPGAPFQTKYPPGYAAYLLPAWLLGGPFPANLPLVTLLNWILLPLLILLCRWAFPDTPWLWPLLALSPYAVLLSISAMSELLSTCLLVAALGVSRRNALAAGLLGAAAFLVKSSMIVLLPAAVLWFVWQRRPRQAAGFALGMAPPVAAWFLWAARHTAPATYDVLLHTQYLAFWVRSMFWSDLPAVLAINLDGLLSGIGGLLSFDPGESFFSLSLARVLAIASLAGAIRSARVRGLSLYHAFALLFAAQLLIWNFTPNERLVFPLFPLLLSGLAATAMHMGALYRTSKVSQPAASRLVIAAGLALLGVAAFRNGDGLLLQTQQLLGRARERAAGLRQVYAWIRTNTPPASVLNTPSDDPVAYLYTGRQSIARQMPTELFYRGDRAGVLRHFSDLPGNPVDYVLLGPTICEHNLSPPERSQVWQALRRRPDLHEVHRSRDWTVLRMAPAERSSLPAPRH